MKPFFRVYTSSPKINLRVWFCLSLWLGIHCSAHKYNYSLHDPQFPYSKFKTQVITLAITVMILATTREYTYNKTTCMHGARIRPLHKTKNASRTSDLIQNSNIYSCDNTWSCYVNLTSHRAFIDTKMYYGYLIDSCFLSTSKFLNLSLCKFL